MHLAHLSLSNFRNYRRIELDLHPGVSVFYGENAQGKTNLLEAVYLLATTRSPRAGSDTEMVRWDADERGPSAARVLGRAVRGRTEVQVEVSVLARPPDADGGVVAPRGVKRVRVNGLPRRAADVVGQVLAVLFTAQDIDLLTGAPSGRRRYLDITLAQVDHPYLRALQRYQRVLQQRNELLRRIGEGRASAGGLAAWNEELVVQGSAIMRARAVAVAALNERAAAIHSGLSQGRERLTLRYAPHLIQPDPRRAALPETLEETRNLFREALTRRQAKEIAAGGSLIGPHRDDLHFDLDGKPAGAFGSRAQQRTVSLALRLAEAAFLRERSDQAPILLLDDMLSELDERRRAAVLVAVEQSEQALITTAELDRFSAAFLQRASRYAVSEGAVAPLGVRTSSPDSDSEGGA